MKFTSLAVAGLILADQGDVSRGFSARPNPALVQQRQVMTSPMQRLSPLKFGEISGGMEELQELTSDDRSTPLEKQIKKSPSFWKMAGMATVPVSAALGFGIVPSRRLAAHAAGAIVTGVAGAIGKSKLESITESMALPAIAQVILDEGLEDPATTAGYVRELKEKYGVVDDVEFECLCAKVYSKYLQGMVKSNPMAKTSELKEVEGLKTALGLSNLQVGEAHAAAAEEWYRTTCLFTPEEDLEDPDHPDRQAMDKLLFMTERVFRQGGETPEAFHFEMTRVAKAMKLTLIEAMERVADVQEPFYQRALKSARSKLGTNQVSSAMLDRARKTLGISDSTAHDMHVSCLNDEVRELLGLEAINDDVDDDEEEITEGEEGEETESVKPPALSDNAKFKEGARERLDQLQEVLGLEVKDLEYELTSEATPFYQQTALAAMKEVLAGTTSADDAWNTMETRREELLLPQANSKELLSSMVTQALGGPLEETNKFATVNNEAAVYDNILEALEAKRAIISILTKSGWDEFDDFDKTFCDPWDSGSVNGFLRPDERIRIYSTFSTRSVRNAKDGVITDEIYDQLLQVKGLMGISDDEAMAESRRAFGPTLQKVCWKATEEIVADYTAELAENMKQEIDEIMTSCRLPDDLLQEFGSACYAKATEQIRDEAPGGIPTPEMVTTLEALRKLFNLEQENVYGTHLGNFGLTYKKSILEAMGSTGVIMDEYKQKLDELRERLGLKDKDARRLFLEAVEEKMIPMVEWVGSEMERTMLTQQQLAQRRGKDMGQDMFQSGKAADGVLGLGAEVNIMGDIINLVDFYTDNGIAEEEQVGTKEVDGEEVPVFETSYPLTALGSKAIDAQMAELLYRQFVVGAFQAQPEQAARYEAARATFGGILGLTSEKMESINDNIGSTVYDNFVSRSMSTKGVLDQQDMMFLANIQGKLGLTSEQGEKLLLQSQKKVLSEEINVIMKDPTPEALKAFREKCNSMGIDLAEDVGISAQRLGKMFDAEVAPGLQDGTITPESDTLTEIQESLELPPEECDSLLEGILQRLAKNTLAVISSEVIRGRKENTVEAIHQLVRFAVFADGELGLVLDEASANEIFNIYDALDFSDVDDETVKSNKEALRTALGSS